jgi:repressor of nif and glnA expression
MSQGRDDAGRFEQTVSDQEILKVFDYEDDPVLTTTEVADGLQRFGTQLTSEAVRQRLEAMAEEGLVSRKKLGARAVGWWAEVAPQLDDATARRVEKRAESDEWANL